EAEIDGAAVAGGGGFPFVKSVGGDEAAALAEGIFEGAPGGEGFGAGVDEGFCCAWAPGGEEAPVGEVDLWLGCVGDDGDLLGGADVVARGAGVSGWRIQGKRSVNLLRSIMV